MSLIGRSLSDLVLVPLYLNLTRRARSARFWITRKFTKISLDILVCYHYISEKNAKRAD
jgi:hypothetical protein